MKKRRFEIRTNYNFTAQIIYKIARWKNEFFTIFKHTCTLEHAQTKQIKYISSKQTINRIANRELFNRYYQPKRFISPRGGLALAFLFGLKFHFVQFFVFNERRCQISSECIKFMSVFLRINQFAFYGHKNTRSKKAHGK